MNSVLVSERQRLPGRRRTSSTASSTAGLKPSSFVSFVSFVSFTSCSRRTGGDRRAERTLRQRI